MVRFIRTATLKNLADLPQVLGFARELNGFMNGKYGVEIEVGLELFGQARLFWTMQADSLAQLEELNTKILADQEYWQHIQKGRAFWMDGSLQDTIIKGF